MRRITLTTILNELYSIGEGLYSIGKGMASLFGYNSPHIKILSEQEAFERDYNALREDWEIVGGDLEKAMRCINHN